MSFNIPQMQNPSVMRHDFSTVPKVEMPRSSFRRSHGHKTAFDVGYVVPIYVDEALPGDTFKLNLSAVTRLTSPLVRPTMDNMYVDYHFFAVPNRLLWDNFKKFMGEQIDPGDSTDYLVPQIDMGANPVVAKTLADYMGIPPGVNNLVFNSLHFRAYNMIWNEFFRDQNIQDSVVVDKDDGPDAIADYVLLKRGKRHDYFTSCLPWPQKGTAVDLPLGATAPVVGTGDAIGIWNGATQYGMGVDVSPGLVGHTSYLGTPAGTAKGAGTNLSGDVSVGLSQIAANSGLIADLSGATAATINELREAFQMQKMLERDARGGTRYTEILLSHYGVTSPDSRMQRPEFLGGGTRRLEVDPVPDTAGNFSYVGDLAATSYGTTSGIGFTKSFTEHCVVLGFASARADLTYQTGMSRMWSRRTKYDFYWPALAHLGEQAVLNQEIYVQGTAADQNVFGYQERWGDYRHKPSLVTGPLRSSYSLSLDYWHLSQDFGALPTLNPSFIEEDPPISRVIAYLDEAHVLMDAFFDVVCTRPMPLRSVPGLIDHF